jgi:hypothetical protein
VVAEFEVDVVDDEVEFVVALLSDLVAVAVETLAEIISFPCVFASQDDCAFSAGRLEDATNFHHRLSFP